VDFGAPVRAPRRPGEAGGGAGHADSVCHSAGAKIYAGGAVQGTVEKVGSVLIINALPLSKTSIE
jgi:hypothetical protein